MKHIVSMIVISICISFSAQGYAHPMRYGQHFCHKQDFFCIQVRSGESWGSLFPNPQSRDLVRRINRMNIRLRPGMVIAIPKYLDRLSIYDVSPFPRYIEPPGQRTIYVNQKKLAWGAYDKDGELLWWGPISPGKGGCRTTGHCLTPTGTFRVIRKQGIDCISTAFPRRANGDDGGAPMPYCMHFFRGYALHGSPEVPGYAASHGCVRMFVEDARWLNEDFVTVPGDGELGTRVVVGSPSTKRHS